MINRREEVEKMYKKINKIVSRGPSFAQTYYDFIEDVIKNKQSDILKDVTYVKYKIDIDGFASTDIFKKESFKKILSFNVSKETQDFAVFLQSKNVFTLGTQFFDSTSNKYLGEIQQFDTSTISSALEIFTFYPSKMRSAIPSFIENPTITFSYKKDTIIYYQAKLYKCYEPYTWNNLNRVTPTFSTYWYEIFPGTMSNHKIIDQDITLFDRYSKSIDILRSYDFKDYSENGFVEENYIDEYFE